MLHRISSAELTELVAYYNLEAEDERNKPKT